MTVTVQPSRLMRAHEPDTPGEIEAGAHRRANESKLLQRVGDLAGPSPILDVRLALPDYIALNAGLSVPRRTTPGQLLHARCHGPCGRFSCDRQSRVHLWSHEDGSPRPGSWCRCGASSQGFPLHDHNGWGGWRCAEPAEGGPTCGKISLIGCSWFSRRHEYPTVAIMATAIRSIGCSWLSQQQWTTETADQAPSSVRACER
jgi:hypothetical protein